MTDEIAKFQQEVAANVAALRADNDVKALARIWLREITRHRYAYNFHWMGRPIIQLPQDMVAMQELVWQIRPDLIIETGVAHGGSLLMNASYLALIEYAEAAKAGVALDPGRPTRHVVGIDIDIRNHNRRAIEAHPMSSRVTLIQGSSIDPDVVAQVSEIAERHSRVMVCLDSNHTHEHVLSELRAYAPLVSKGSYCIVFDTLVEDMPDEFFANRPWGHGNNPKTAVRAFLREQQGFVIDRDIEAKLQITVAPDGWLKRR